ncbi:MAG: TetR/AcrR family transcriptional regulator [Lachnospiraceae bacterium]|nr:TetR/AcrR family transcriptional regulator [Lachnospiraceae bacterium]
MGEKSIQKKQFILDTARQIFMNKGYNDVTMKDIVDACEISRGGLYLYFDSTKDIFMEVLRMESKDTDDIFTNSISEDSSITDILGIFLKEQKKEILSKKNNLTIATYEFFFKNKVAKKENPIRNTFDCGVKVLAELIASGVESGELYCDDCMGAAKNIMFVLEGLKVSAQTMGITEDQVDHQLLYIMQGLIIEE